MGEQREAESSDDDLEIASVVRRDLGDIDDSVSSKCINHEGHQLSVLTDLS